MAHDVYMSVVAYARIDPAIPRGFVSISGERVNFLNFHSFRIQLLTFVWSCLKFIYFEDGKALITEAEWFSRSCNIIGLKELKVRSLFFIISKPNKCICMIFQTL